MLEGVFEQAIAMAKHRIDGEKNLSHKIRHVQKSFLAQINHVNTALASLPTPESTMAEIEHFTQTTASMHAKLAILEEENKRLVPQVEGLKAQMSKMSIDLGQWKEKAQTYQIRVDHFDRDSLDLRTQISELSAKVVCSK